MENKKLNKTMGKDHLQHVYIDLKIITYFVLFIFLIIVIISNQIN